MNLSTAVGPEPAKATAPPVDRVGWHPLPVVFIVAIACSLAFGLWKVSRQLAPEIIPQAATDSAYVASFPERSIAVLPFADTGARDETSPLADVIQDDLINALSHVADLRVISRTSVSSYEPSQPRNLRAIAQSLGAGHILEGTIKHRGTKVEVIVQLTDARLGKELWKVSYEQPAHDVCIFQNDLVWRVISQLKADVSVAERAAIREQPTHDLIAYDHYVRAKTLVASVGNTQINEQLLQAVQLLKEAIARDPNFYLAWCELASAHDYIYFFGFDHTAARLHATEEALNALQRLRPNAGETHLARATYFYRCHLDYEKARAELALTERALPNNSEAFELSGYIDRRQGRWAESFRSLQRAVKLDPRNSFLFQQIAASYQEFRQFGAMAAAFDRALGIVPNDTDARVGRAAVDLEWRADAAPLHRTIDALLAANPASAGDFADQWLYLTLCERDSRAAARALAAVPASGISTDLNFPRSYCAALVARAAGDEATARKAFLAARAEVEQTVKAQPDYGPIFTVLGLIDAGLGRKEDALREGRHALELLPVTKDAIDGAEVMKYLGVIYAWCGEKDLALAQIAATLRIPSTLSYGNLKLHPYWDALRGDPRFEKLLAEQAPKQ